MTSANRLYRGRRQSLAAPGLVVVSVVPNIVGGRRKLLDPRLPATAERHHSMCSCGLDWGARSPGATLLGIAILADHFEHSTCDLPVAKQIMQCPNDPSPMDAATSLGPRLAQDVLAEIPSSFEWSITTAILCQYLSFLTGNSRKPVAALASIDPGTETMNVATVTQSDPDVTAIAAFIHAAKDGKITPLPTIVAEQIVTTFTDCVRRAVVDKQHLAPIIGAQIGPVVVKLGLFAEGERVQLERMLGPAKVRAMLTTMQDLFGVPALRDVFGEWVSPE